MTPPYPFLEVLAPMMVIGLRSGSMEKNSYLCMQSYFDENVSLSRDTTTMRPLVQIRRIDSSISEALIIDFSSVETLG